MDELNYKENSFPLLSPGTVLYEKYEILYVIGQGGCGRVYKARDINSHDTSWAVKEIFSLEGPSCFNMNVKEIFQREASMLSSLKHKNIPKIKEYFINEPVYYIVMEYIEGKTLQEIYKSEGRLWTEKELAKLAISLCDVLEYLHEHSVVFRDLKTKNIIIDEYDVPKLIDFGIARYFRADQTEDTIKIGTVGYAAPEQYGKKGGGSDRRTDIYSLGVLLHYLATGEDPEEKEDPFNFTPIRELNQEISEDFEDLINKCIKFRKDERFASVREIKKKLHVSHYRISADLSLEKYSGRFTNPAKKYIPSFPPGESKIKIISEEHDRYIIIPPVGITADIGTVLFMIIWLAVWTIGGIAAISSLIKDFSCFIAFWLCVWAVGETFVIYGIITYLTSMFGGVQITFDREYMKIKIYWLGLFPGEKSYPLSGLTDLNLETGNKIPGDIENPISIKSEGKKINIPFKKTEEENEWFYNEIKSILGVVEK